VKASEETHPVNNGSFGVVGSFNLQTSLESAMATKTGEQVIASAGNSSGVLAFEDALSLTRIVTQNFLAVNTGGVNATVQREKLFKNAVSWLLKLPGAPPFMNVRLSTDDFPSQIRVGQEKTLTITVQHTGEIQAAGVILTLSLPSNLTFLSAVADNGNSVVEDQYVICFLPNLERADSSVVTLKVRANAAGTADITGGVSENQAEAVLDDNYFKTTLDIIP
jgi:uncharacterized repeat protein (TIGR01451 family)